MTAVISMLMVFAGDSSASSTALTEGFVRPHESAECRSLHGPCRGRTTGGGVFLPDPWPVINAWGQLVAATNDQRTVNWSQQPVINAWGQLVACLLFYCSVWLCAARICHSTNVFLCIVFVASRQRDPASVTAARCMRCLCLLLFTFVVCLHRHCFCGRSKL